MKAGRSNRDIGQRRHACRCITVPVGHDAVSTGERPAAGDRGESSEVGGAVDDVDGSERDQANPLGSCELLSQRRAAGGFWRSDWIDVPRRRGRLLQPVQVIDVAAHVTQLVPADRDKPAVNEVERRLIIVQPPTLFSQRRTYPVHLRRRNHASRPKYFVFFDACGRIDVVDEARR